MTIKAVQQMTAHGILAIIMQKHLNYYYNDYNDDDGRTKFIWHYNCYDKFYELSWSFPKPQPNWMEWHYNETIEKIDNLVS